MCSPMPDFSDDELNDVPPVCVRWPTCDVFDEDNCNWPNCEEQLPETD